MAKSLSSLWLKTVKRMGRAQQAQGRKLFKSLVSEATKATKVTTARKTAVKTAPRVSLAPKRSVTAATPVPRKSPGRVPAGGLKLGADPLTSLPGSWKKSFFTLPAVGRAAPRRMLYWLYLPARPSAGPRPLVVMLHGCQQSVADFATSTRMNALAEKKGFAVLYPQQSGTADRHRCWHWYKKQTQQGAGDVGLIARLVAEVQAEQGLDSRRTYVAGLSAGAGLAALLALCHPALFAAVGLHSAPVFGAVDSALTAYGAMQQGSAQHSAAANAWVLAATQQGAAAGMPAFLIHGDADPVVRRINLHQQVQQFRIVNAAAISQPLPERASHPARGGGKPRRAFQTVSYFAGRKPQVVSCEIAGLGHAWSGGDARVNFSEAEGPDASALLWQFFARHRRNRPR